MLLNEKWQQLNLLATLRNVCTNTLFLLLLFVFTIYSTMRETEPFSFTLFSLVFHVSILKWDFRVILHVLFFFWDISFSISLSILFVYFHCVCVCMLFVYFINQMRILCRWKKNGTKFFKKLNDIVNASY